MYRLQPILDLESKNAHAYELLFSGTGGPDAVVSWPMQDMLMFTDYIPQKLARDDCVVRLNVNLTSASALCIPDSAIQYASDKFKLVIEWSEKSFSKKEDKLAAELFAMWREKYGVEVAIDDAGEGHCLFSRYLLIKPDYVKLDGTLLQRAKSCKSHHSVATTISGFCADNEIPLVVEWIENQADLDYSTNVLHAQYGQGFFIDDWADSISIPADVIKRYEPVLTGVNYKPLDLAWT